MICVEPGGTAAARDDALVALHGLSGGCVVDSCVGKVCSTSGADDALSSGGAWPAQEADGARHSQHATAPAPSKVLVAVREEVNRMVDTHQANHAMPATSSFGPSREGAFGRPGSRQVGRRAETWAARRCANRTSHVSSEASKKGSPGWPRDVADACVCQGGTSLADMSTVDGRRAMILLVWVATIAKDRRPIPQEHWGPRDGCDSWMPRNATHGFEARFPNRAFEGGLPGLDAGGHAAPGADGAQMCRTAALRRASRRVMTIARRTITPRAPVHA